MTKLDATGSALLYSTYLGGSATELSLDTGALLAGTRFRGDFEERFNAVIHALAKRRMPILFIGKYRQAAGEFEDSRIRLRRKISKDVERGRREILADMLEVVDNLDRAIDSAVSRRRRMCCCKVWRWSGASSWRSSKASA